MKDYDYIKSLYEYPPTPDQEYLLDRISKYSIQSTESLLYGLAMSNDVSLISTKEDFSITNTAYSNPKEKLIVIPRCAPEVAVALFFHELGHLKYTTDKLRSGLLGYIQNILEDCKVELKLLSEHKSYAPYLKYVRDKFLVRVSEEPLSLLHYFFFSVRNRSQVNLTEFTQSHLKIDSILFDFFDNLDVIDATMKIYKVLTSPEQSSNSKKNISDNPYEDGEDSTSKGTIESSSDKEQSEDDNESSNEEGSTSDSSDVDNESSNENNIESSDDKESSEDESVSEDDKESSEDDTSSFDDESSSLFDDDSSDDDLNDDDSSDDTSSEGDNTTPSNSSSSDAEESFDDYDSNDTSSDELEEQYEEEAHSLENLIIDRQVKTSPGYRMVVDSRKEFKLFLTPEFTPSHFLSKFRISKDSVMKFQSSFFNLFSTNYVISNTENSGSLRRVVPFYLGSNHAFRRMRIKQALNVEVFLLIDQSGSMSYFKQYKVVSFLFRALSNPLFHFRAFTFNSSSCNEVNFDSFSPYAIGSTPEAEAVNLVTNEFKPSTNGSLKRNVLITLTDGMPDNPDDLSEVISKYKDVCFINLQYQVLRKVPYKYSITFDSTTYANTIANKLKHIFQVEWNNN